MYVVGKGIKNSVEYCSELFNSAGGVTCDTLCRNGPVKVANLILQRLVETGDVL